MLLSGTRFFRTRFLILICCLFYFSSNSSAQINADFSTNVAGGCSPLAVSFINNTIGASTGATYYWDFGNGNSSTQQSPSAIFLDEKNYTVTLTVKDGSQVSIKSKDITVSAPPIFDFTPSSIKGCLPLTINFSSSVSSGNANNYTWDFGDGNVLQNGGSNTQHTYTVPQKAPVSLTVSNIYGCSKTVTKQNLIEILPAITASFSSDKTILCRVTDAVQFTNSSTGPGTLSYIWDFGDGTTSILKTPSHKFNTKGIYTVKLTVLSSEGCTISSTQNGYINVASFSSDFAVPVLNCSQNQIYFNNTSSPYPASSEWYVDGILESNYQSNFSRYFANAGNYKIELKNKFDQCRDSVLKTVIINQTPNPDGFISETTNACGAPALYNFKDTTAGVSSWAWDFNYNNYYTFNPTSTLKAPSYTFTSNGSYNVGLKVTTPEGCSAITSKYIAVLAPNVQVTSSGTAPVCGPYSLTFSSVIYPSTETITQFNWDFGDGTTSTSPQPTHLFSNPGSYGVRLTYTTSSGCTGNASYGSVNVYGMPVANFTANATTICGNTFVTFTALPQALNVSYQWDFGDGPDYSYNTNVISHQYTKDTVYTVRLIVYNPGGCRDTMTRVDYIKVLPPFPIITGVTNTCDGDRGLVKFSQASKKAINYTWYFGDGTSTSLSTDQPEITHHYSATGNYKTVLATTNGQCTTRDSINTYVLLKQNPLLSATVGNICENATVPITITNMEQNPYGNAYGYVFEKIQYNDLTPYQGYINSPNQNYYWNTAFSGTLNGFEKGKTGLRIISRSSVFYCSDTTNFIPLSIIGSHAGFQVITPDICFKLPVVFKDTSTTNSTIVSWQWNFGDGNTQTYTTGGIVKHTYANPGNYSVVLTITDASGCNSVTSQYQTVNVSGPKAIFYPSANNTFITLPVTFYNYSNIYNTTQVEYKWRFDDGNVSTDFSPQHAYPVPGQYTVTLIAFNSLTGCSDTTTSLVIVNNFDPVFAINSSYLTSKNCPPLLVRFTNNSINYQSVKWDFGDGNTADNLNYPSHIYEKAGKYIVKLFVYGPGGLTGTYLDSVIIKQATGSFVVDKNEGCIGLTPHFTASSTYTNLFTWDFGDGSIISGNNKQQAYTYNVAGIYKPTLLLTDSSGCTSAVSLPGNINIHPNPTVSILPNDPRVCRGQSINLVASGGKNYQWSPAGSLSNPSIAAPSAKPDSTTTYSLIVKDELGCMNTAKVTLTVIQKQEITVSRDTAVCLGNAVQLFAQGADNYEWINVTTGLSNTSVSNPVARPITNTTYTVKGSDKYNCFSDMASIKVKVLSLPTVSISPLPELLLGTPVQITSISSADVVKWLWTPADYLNCSNCASPVTTPLAALNYKLTVTNNDGCQATANLQLKLQCQADKVFIPNAFTPNNDGLNDRFNIKGISIVKHLVIYGRWGNIIYERSNYNAAATSAGWDGNYKGQPMPADTYVYFAEMECSNGESFIRKGTVVLVR
ncbi:MAG: PKD domain-containing protein [Ferruginibacter sp.]